MIPADDEDWTASARCRDHLDLFDRIYHGTSGPDGRRQRERDIAEARLICRACPVRRQCHAYATELIRTPGHGGTPRHGWHGFWAGTDFGRRADVLDTPEEEAS